MAEIIPRIYGNFRGVDFRGDDINLIRSPDSLNVWKDYKHTESIRTRPGMELHSAADGTVHGIYFFKGEMITHIGQRLVAIDLTDGFRNELLNGLADNPSNGFVYEDVFYFMDGKNYFQYDGGQCKRVEGFVPTTSIARKPQGGGKDYQDINMISDYRINTFLADGESIEYYLDTMNIDDDYYPIVTVDGITLDEGDYDVDFEKGVVELPDVPPAPKTDGQDNVTIKFKKAIPRYKNSILGCTLLQVFDNRVFVSGNKTYPNFVWHCSLDDPTYFSDLDYYREGMDEAQVTGMVAGNNALWVFREPSDANTNIFYHTPTIDDEYGKIYPSSHSSVTAGCVGKAINFNDDIVFFSERGMEGISGDITTEQVVELRSTLVNRKLIAEKDYKKMILAEWSGYLFVFIGDKAYLADSRAVFNNEDHIEYEWFYWHLEKEITAAKVHDGVLYLGTSDGVYTLTDNESDIESYWVTPKDNFKYPHKQKTTNKRGCVGEATGDIAVYAKLEDTEFELIGEYKNVTDYFVSRIKRKKFKDLQLKFYSKTRFSLETVSLECFVGGYIKR